MSIVTLSASELIAWHTYPFPPDPDHIYELDALAHLLELQLSPGTIVLPDSASGTVTVFSDSAEAKTATVRRSRWVALATSATLRRAVAQQELAGRLGDANTDAVLALNRTELTAHVDGLLASPPVVEVVSPVTTRRVVVIGGIVIVIVIPGQPPNPQPHWEDGQQLGRLDLVAAAVRFQASADALEAGQLRDELTLGANRLLEAAQLRA